MFLAVSLIVLSNYAVFSQNTEFYTPDLVPAKVKEYVADKVLNMPEFIEGNKITVNYLVSNDSIFRIEYMETNKVEYYDLVNERLTNIEKDELNNQKNRGTLNIALGWFRDLPNFYGDSEQPYHDIYLQESNVYSEFYSKHVDWGYSSHHFEQSSWSDCDGRYILTTQKITLFTKKMVWPNTTVFYSCEFPNVSSDYNNKYFENTNIPVDNNAGYYAVDFRIDYTPANILGNNFFCLNEQSTFSLNDIYCPGSTVSWSSSNNLTYVSGQGTYNYKVQANGNGNAWVQANINGSAIRKNVWVGLKATLSGDNSVLYPKTGTWTANATCETTPYNYEWWLRKEGQQEVLVANSPFNSLTLQSVKNLGGTKQPIEYTTYYLYARVNDASGATYTTDTRQITAYGNVNLVPAFSPMKNEVEQPEVEPIIVYPNPTSSVVTVKIPAKIIETNKDVEIVILDKYMQTQKNIKACNPETVINVSGFNTGVYFLQVKHNGKLHSQALIIE